MSNNIIYGLKSNGKFHYIGKRNFNVLKVSDVKVQYKNSKIRNVILENDNIELVKLKEVNGNWYDEKLLEVVNKHKKNNPLINAQWMLEGKRGFWEGKTRDENTLQKLSQSKYKKILQYDINGFHSKTFDSIKEAAIQVFGDYEVINGSGESYIYSLLRTKRIENRFKKNGYWFKEEELIDAFGSIPFKLNISAIKQQQKLKSRKLAKKPINTTKRTVNQYNENGEIINVFDNTFHAAYELKISVQYVQRLCRGHMKNKNYLIKYGKPKFQKFEISYPDYVIDYKPEINEPKFRYSKTGKITYQPKTRTRCKVYQCDVNGNIIKPFDSVKEASLKLKMSENKIRYLCAKGNICENNNDKYILKLGEKIQTKL